MFLLPSQKTLSSGMENSDLGLALDDEDSEDDEEVIPNTKPNKWNSFLQDNSMNDLQKEYEKFNPEIPKKKENNKFKSMDWELQNKIARIRNKIKNKKSISDIRKNIGNDALKKSLSVRNRAENKNIKKKFIDPNFIHSNPFQNNKDSNVDTNIDFLEEPPVLKQNDFGSDSFLNKPIEWNKVPEEENLNHIGIENSLDPWDTIKDPEPKKFSMEDSFQENPITENHALRNHHAEERNSDPENNFLRQFKIKDNYRSDRERFRSPHFVRNGIREIKNRWDSNSRNWHKIDNSIDNSIDDDDDDDDE